MPTLKNTMWTQTQLGTKCKTRLVGTTTKCNHAENEYIYTVYICIRYDFSGGATTCSLHFEAKSTWYPLDPFGPLVPQMRFAFCSGNMVQPRSADKLHSIQPYPSILHFGEKNACRNILESHVEASQEEAPKNERFLGRHLFFLERYAAQIEPHIRSSGP